MMDKVLNILKNGTLTIPRLLLTNYKNFQINELDVIILIYLLNEKEAIFNPIKISEDLNLNKNEVLMSIEELTNKDLIKIELKKINNIHEEYLNFEPFYTKLGYMVVNEEEIKAEDSNNIFSVFESEFGRTLSPIEYQIINGWIEDQLSEDMIIEALKEATYNGVSNLRYIDKILYEWRKKGYHSKDDIEKNRNNFNKKEVKKEMFDYNWLDDQE